MSDNANAYTPGPVSPSVTSASTPAPVAAPAWPADFAGFIDMLRGVSADDYTNLHAGSWMLTAADGALVPVALLGTAAGGGRYAVSIVGAGSAEAALLAANPIYTDAPITFEELSEAWSWFAASPDDNNDRINVVLARMRWRKIGRGDALWPVSPAAC